MKKISEIFWGTFGAIVLVSSLIAGAWWHIATATVCAVMWWVSRLERKQEETQQP